MVNGDHDHFQPLLYRNKALAKQTQEQKDSYAIQACQAVVWMS
ncbi:ankyrin repeat domain protein [Wolbachia endosymbiont of Drosophila ananassae]|nr:ankyrin repeat domain protein [Wolbachia endosymbiont of Drosophila ananassae]